jgi:hypothetical protein
MALGPNNTVPKGVKNSVLEEYGSQSVKLIAWAKG